MATAGDERRPRRFTVPTELLRLAGDEGTGTGPDREDTPDGADRGSNPGPRPLDGALVRQVVLRSLTAAVTVSVLAAARAGAPRMEASFHAGDTGLEALLVAAVVAGALTAPASAMVVGRWARGATGGGPMLAAVALGAVAAASPSLGVLSVVLLGVALAAAVQVLSQLSWIAGASVPGARGRLLALYAVVGAAGAIVGGGAAAAVAHAVGWRVAMLVPVAGAPAAFGPRAPDRPVGPTPGIGETAQRLRRLRSFAGILAGASVTCFAAIGAPVLAAVWMRHRWHTDLAGRGGALVVVLVGAIAGAPLGGWIADRAPSARSLGSAAGWSAAAFGVAFGASAWLPSTGMLEAAWTAAATAAAVLAVLWVHTVLAVSPAAGRPAALGVCAAWGALAALGATAVVAAVGQADGWPTALAAAGLVCAGAGAVIRWAAAATDRDAGDALAAEEEAASAGARARRSDTALEVRGVDFSYGSRQVLFGVGLRIEDGEVAALLGTNGAGKSTLLRLVAGLDHPTAGSIHLWGTETTYLEAEQLVGQGVAMLPGGRMSFPSLTVVENLRVGGHAIRRQPARLQAAIDEALDLFPVLGDRRNQRVGTLSGGEQQMLALARVLITGPRLLLIDELTLGLAPKAVEALLAIVRRVNEEGTTVVLVEQSVNLALTLAAHALFLERGEVRFDGATADLLTRDDLLRPVFLAGSGA